MTEPRTRLTTKDLARAADERRRDDSSRPKVDTPKVVETAKIDTVERTPRMAATPAAVDESGHASLFHDDEAAAFRSRWEAIQTGFVDEPRTAVEEADALVAQAVARLAEVFSEERSTLEQQWDKGDNISTEDLRIALRRYRSFFDRLLTV
jgi:hypothetical protein